MTTPTLGIAPNGKPYINPPVESSPVDASRIRIVAPPIDEIDAAQVTTEQSDGKATTDEATRQIASDAVTQIKAAAVKQGWDYGLGQWIDTSLLDGMSHDCPRCREPGAFTADADFAKTGAISCANCTKGATTGDGISTTAWLHREKDLLRSIKRLAKRFALSSKDKPKKRGPKPDAKDADPCEEATAILKSMSTDGYPHLRFWAGSYWQWTGGRFVAISNSEVRAWVVNHLSKSYDMVGSNKVTDTLEHLRAKCILSSLIHPPTWLEESTWQPEDTIATRNAIIHLPSFVEGREYSINATPAFFNVNAVDYRFEHNRPDCPMWKEFLFKLWPDDPESIELLQDWFGYCLTPDTRQQKILMLIGPRRCGKGTIARVLTSIVGDVNVCDPTLSGLSTNFGLWPLLGKSLAIISDARLSGRSDHAVITERLLSISGEDSQTVDRKRLEPVTTKLLSRFMIVSNELPRLQDTSGALAGRMMILRLVKSFYGVEDHTLTSRLLTERCGILHWAIDGWRRLRERGRFQQPKSGEGLRSNWMNSLAQLPHLLRIAVRPAPSTLSNAHSSTTHGVSGANT